MLICLITGAGADLTATLSGRLTVAEAPALRLRLLSCIAEQPPVLVIDLGRMSVDRPATMGVFDQVIRQARSWPGTLVLLSAAYPSLDRARQDARRHCAPVPSIHHDIDVGRGAARLGRNLATEACLRYSLPDLAGPAGVITSELISNVLDHVGRPATLRVALWPGRLSIGVRDLSAAPPIRTDGRGLVLVDAMATGWGWLPTGTGKTVWATISR